MSNTTASSLPACYYFFSLQRIWHSFSLTKGSRHEAFELIPLMSGNTTDSFWLLSFFFSVRVIVSAFVCIYAHLRTISKPAATECALRNGRYCKTFWSSTVGVALGPPPFHTPPPPSLRCSLQVSPHTMNITRLGNDSALWNEGIAHKWHYTVGAMRTGCVNQRANTEERVCI